MRPTRTINLKKKTVFITYTGLSLKQMKHFLRRKSGFKVTLRTRIWLIIGFYKPPSHKKDLNILSAVLSNFVSKYEHIILQRDFTFWKSMRKQPYTSWHKKRAMYICGRVSGLCTRFFIGNLKQNKIPYDLVPFYASTKAI